MKTLATALLTIGTIVTVEAQNNNGYSNNYYDNIAYNTGYGNNNSYGYTNTSYYSNYGYYNNGWSNGYNDYNSYWNIKKVTKNYLMETGMFLNNMLYQYMPHPFTSPLLSKAVRHQRFAKQLYHQGFYDEALQHSNYARVLTMKAANFMNPYLIPDFTDFGFFSNGYYDDGYRKGNPNSNNGTGNSGDGYRKGKPAENNQKTTAPESKGLRQISKKEMNAEDINALEKALPKDNLPEKDLLKVKSKDLTIE